MNTLNLKRIVDYFEDVRKRPHLYVQPEGKHEYVQPVTPEAFYRHAMSLMAGVMLSVDTLTWDDFISARQHAVQSRGWENRAFSAYLEMREKGYDDDQIIPELIDIEITMWGILRDWEKDNMAKSSP